MKEKINLKFIRKLFLAGSLISVLISCNNDDDEQPVNEEESITKVSFVVTQGAETKTYSWEEGKTDQTIVLDKAKTTDVEVKFFNGTKEITAEIIAEKDEHFITYSFSNALINLTRTDDSSTTRTDGKKLGIKTQWSTSATSGTSNISLKLIHEPTSVNDSGNGSSIGGSTDIDVTLPIQAN